MNKLFKLLPGYVRYRVNIHNPSKSAGLLMLYFPETVFDVRVENDSSFVFSCSALAAGKIKKSQILEGVEAEKMSAGGLLKLCEKFKLRIGLFIGLVLIAVILYLKEGTVWDIRVSGNTNVSDEEIIQALSKVDFYPGKNISKDDLTKICNRFIITEERISWISINMSGNVAFVEVKERTLPENIVMQPSMSGVMSSHDCIIELPEVTSGTSLVEPGNTVKKGQMIISPVALGRDGNEYIVGASGTVLGKTYETFCVAIPLKETIRSFSGRVKKEYEFTFLSKKIFSGIKSSHGFKSFLNVGKKKKVMLSDEIELPIYMLVNEKHEYSAVDKDLTQDEARERAYNKMYSVLSDEMKNAEILSTAFTENVEDDMFVLWCKTECIRNVAVYG